MALEPTLVPLALRLIPLALEPKLELLPELKSDRILQLKLKLHRIPRESNPELRESLRPTLMP